MKKAKIISLTLLVTSMLLSACGGSSESSSSSSTIQSSDFESSAVSSASNVESSVISSESESSYFDSSFDDSSVFDSSSDIEPSSSSDIVSSSEEVISSSEETVSSSEEIVSSSEEVVSSSEIESSIIESSEESSSSIEESSSEEDKPVSVTINNLNSDVVNISYKSQEIMPGEIFSFTISCKKNGYEIDSMNATNSSGGSVKLSNSGDDKKFFFVVPNDGILNVSSTIKAKDIKAYIHDEKGLISGLPLMSVNGGDFKEVDNLDSESGVNFYTFKYDSKVKFYLKDLEYIVAKGINVDGVFYERNKSDFVQFDCTLEDFEYFFLDLEVVYEDNTPYEGEYIFEVLESTHLSCTFYSDELGNVEINSTDVNKMVYVRITSTDPDYMLKEIKVDAVNSDTGTRGSYADIYYDSVNDLYHFKTPFAYNNVVRVQLIELNCALLKGYNIVGNYLAFWLSSSNYATYDQFKYDFAIDGAGRTTMGEIGKSTNRSGYIVSATAKSGVGETTDDRGHNMYYSDTVLITNVDPTEGFGSPFGSFDVVCVKKADPSDSNNDYIVYGENFVLDNVRYSIVQVIKDEVTYASVLIDKTNREIYFDVKIQFYSGNNVCDDTAIYEVFVDENKVLGVSYKDNGGKENRIALSSPLGVYHSGDDLLIIPNYEKAIYKDEMYIVSIDGTTAKLSNASVILTFTLDFTNMTFVFVKEEPNIKTGPEFSGLTFTGNFENDWDYLTIIIEFDINDSGISGTLYIKSGVYYFMEFTGQFDANTNILTLNNTDVCGYKYSQTASNYTYMSDFAYASYTLLVSNKSLTFKSNIVSNNAFAVKNAVVTCDSFDF